MAIGTALAIGSGIAGVAGAVAGALKGAGKSSVQLAPQSALGAQGEAQASQSMSQFADLVGQGPGAQDVAAGVGSQRDLASLLQQYQQSGGIPSAQDVSQSQSFAGAVFGGQRAALRDSFLEQSQGAAQQAALMGRSPLDPVLRNKLAQEQTRQGRQLEAQQGSFAAQYAQQQPEKRLGFAQGRANVLGGLATQAMANRQALFSMGQNALQTDNQMRLGSASKSQTSGQEGVFNAISGGLGALGSGLKASSSLMGLFNTPDQSNSKEN